MTLALIVTFAGIILMLTGGCGPRRPALALVTFFLIASHLCPLLVSWVTSHVLGVSFSRTDRTTFTALNIAAIATITLAFGYRGTKAFLHRDLHQGVANLPAQSTARPPPASLATAQAAQVAHLASVALVSALIMLQPLGPLGFAKLAMTRVPVEGFIFSIIYVAACVNALTCCAWLTISLRLGKPIPWLSIMLSTLIFFALGGRVQLVITALAYVLAYAAHRHVRTAPLILLLVVLGVLFNTTLLIRLTLQGALGLSYAETLTLNLVQASALDGYAFADRYVREIGHKPFLYVDSLRLLTPRVLDPDKPEQLSRLMRLMVARDRLGGLTNGVFGEFYVIGGYVVVAVGSFLYGSALALLDWSFHRGRSLNAATSALVFIMIPILTLYVTRGGLDVAIFRIATVLTAVGIGLTAIFILNSKRNGTPLGATHLRSPDELTRGMRK